MGVLSRRPASGVPSSLAIVARVVFSRRVLLILMLVAFAVKLLGISWQTQNTDTTLFRTQQNAAFFSGRKSEDALRPVEALSSRPTIAKLYWQWDTAGDRQNPDGSRVNELEQESIMQHFAYDKQHGIASYLLTSSMLDGSWNRPAYMLEILSQELAKPEDERLQWLVWTDANVVLTNPNIPLTTFLPPFNFPGSSANLLITNDFKGLTSSIFFLRVNKWSYHLLTSLLSQDTYHPGASSHTNIDIADQAALASLLDEFPHLRRGVVYLPQRWFNAYTLGLRESHSGEIVGHTVDQVGKDAVWKPGDLHIHFSDDTEYTQMREVLALASAHIPAWERSAAETGLEAEVKSFWVEERKRAEERREEARKEEEVKRKIQAAETQAKWKKMQDEAKARQEKLAADRLRQGLAEKRLQEIRDRAREKWRGAGYGDVRPPPKIVLEV